MLSKKRQTDLSNGWCKMSKIISRFLQLVLRCNSKKDTCSQQPKMLLPSLLVLFATLRAESQHSCSSDTYQDWWKPSGSIIEIRSLLSTQVVRCKTNYKEKFFSTEINEGAVLYLSYNLNKLMKCKARTFDNACPLLLRELHYFRLVWVHLVLRWLSQEAHSFPFP